MVNVTVSQNWTLKYGITHGSVLGPVQFTLYTHALNGVVQPDIPLLCWWLIAEYFLSFFGGKIKISGTFVTVSFRMVNSNWTKLRVKLFTDSLIIMNCQIPFVLVVCNLVVFFDSAISFDPHLGHLCKVLYLLFCKLSQMLLYLTKVSTKNQDVTFILSWLDYCIIVLTAIPDEFF